MKFKFGKFASITFLLLVVQLSFAQKKEETIGSEVVNVVKPYTPTISDAFKIQETAVLDDEGNAKKETIKYSIFSFPVASTFTPSKGKAAGVDKTKQAKLYTNYATLGFGSYRTLNAELFVTQELGNDDYVGGMFRHLSSQGGISGVELDDRYYDTGIDLTYGANTNALSWNVDVGYKNQIYNWYGLPVDFGNTLTPSVRNTLINSIDPQHVFSTISAAAKVEINEGVLDAASLKFAHFTDTYGSAENSFSLKPSLKFDVLDEAVKTNLIVDYVGGSFENNYLKTNTAPLKYSFTNLGIAPSFVMQQDDWTLNLGIAVIYGMDNQNSNNNLYIYPQINASYKVVGDLMIFYAGAEGNLEQNSYLAFASQNYFLSPTLTVAPTDKQYDIFAGLKGKIVDNVSYNIKGSYVNEKNKAFFKSNNYNENDSNEDYGYGNSFQVIYDNMKTLSFSGDLKADFSENVTFGINGAYNTFVNANEQEPWNLPKLKLNASLDFNITPKWFAGTAVFYVGERKDSQMNTDFNTIETAVVLPSYFDANAHLGYKYNDRLTGFLKANNIANQAYEKWLNYQVQGFQIVVGANYKFDF